MRWTVPTETPTPAAMVRIDSSRRRRARIAARLPPTLRRFRAAARPCESCGRCRGDGLRPKRARGRGKATAQVLAVRDALEHLDPDPAPEQVRQDQQPLEEIAAEAVDLLDSEQIIGPDVVKGCLQ